MGYDCWEAPSGWMLLWLMAWVNYDDDISLLLTFIYLSFDI